jgi:hypothetical protein
VEHFKLDFVEICCDGIRVAQDLMRASFVSSFRGVELSVSAATDFTFSVFEGERVVN